MNENMLSDYEKLLDILGGAVKQQQRAHAKGCWTLATYK